MFSDLPKITQQSGLRLRPCPHLDGSVTVSSQPTRRGWKLGGPHLCRHKTALLWAPRVMESGNGPVALGVRGPQQG